MSTKMSQKDAVYNAVTSVLSEAGITINEGQNVAELLTREHRAQVTNILVEGFNSGSIELDKSFASDSALRVYCSGLTSNWLRKDRRLNGNIKYEPKNPGSRVGSTDESLKAMRALLKTATNPVDRAEIQGFIDERVAQLAASKTKAVVVNYDALPPELAAKFAPSSQS